MRHFEDPRHPFLFDPYDGVFSPLARKRPEAGWPALFRAALLELMPATWLGQHYHPTLGRPTKELYSLAGLLFLQENFDWTNADAVDAYLFRSDVQFALNLTPGVDELCERTLERYRKLFIEDDLAARTMHAVTARLVELLELDIGRQRLDSTHVFSAMACFGRTRLLGVTVKRFLVQVKRHAPAAYEALPEPVRQRYAPSVGRLFSQKRQSGEQRAKTLQQVAEDARDLIDRFAADESMAGRPSYQSLARAFADHCEIVADKVKVRPKANADSMQNPSDPDASYDGLKGQGYKLQISETCGEGEGQLIVGALAQTASAHDANALKPMLEQLQEWELLPESMMADTAYGSDDNVRAAEALGVELASPVAGPKGDGNASAESDAKPGPEPLSIDDFAVDERTGKVEACPAGRIPLRVICGAESETTAVEMKAEYCNGCEFVDACPVRKKGEKFEASYTDKQRRLEGRRREQQTEAFQERYAKRSGMEGTNGGLKRRMGLGKLRVRGMKAVAHALYLRVAGWNALRAVRSGKLMAEVREILARRGLGGPAGAAKGAGEGVFGPSGAWEPFGEVCVWAFRPMREAPRSGIALRLAG